MIRVYSMDRHGAGEAYLGVAAAPVYVSGISVAGSDDFKREIQAVKVENIIRVQTGRSQTDEILRTYYGGVNVYRMKLSGKTVYDTIDGGRYNVRILVPDANQPPSEKAFVEKYKKMNTEWTQADLDNWKKKCSIANEKIQRVKGLKDANNREYKENMAWRISLK